MSRDKKQICRTTDNVSWLSTQDSNCSSLNFPPGQGSVLFIFVGWQCCFPLCTFLLVFNLRQLNRESRAGNWIIKLNHRLPPLQVDFIYFPRKETKIDSQLNTRTTNAAKCSDPIFPIDSYQQKLSCTMCTLFRRKISHHEVQKKGLRCLNCEPAKTFWVCCLLEHFQHKIWIKYRNRTAAPVGPTFLTDSLSGALITTITQSMPSIELKKSVFETQGTFAVMLAFYKTMKNTRLNCNSIKTGVMLNVHTVYLKSMR